MLKAIKSLLALLMTAIVLTGCNHDNAVAAGVEHAEVLNTENEFDVGNTEVNDNLGTINFMEKGIVNIYPAIPGTDQTVATEPVGTTEDDVQTYNATGKPRVYKYTDGFAVGTAVVAGDRFDDVHTFTVDDDGDAVIALYNLKSCTPTDGVITMEVGHIDTTALVDCTFVVYTHAKDEWTTATYKIESDVPSTLISVVVNDVDVLKIEVTSDAATAYGIIFK